MDSPSVSPGQRDNFEVSNKSRANRQNVMEDVDSPEDSWSGPGSGNDTGKQNGSNVSHGEKRKRPISVSYA